MSHDGAEVGAFVTKADGLLVNLGTLDPAMRAAMMTALDVAEARSLPWVLDPVFADRSAGRAAFATELLARRPAALRLNEAEAAALGAGPVDAARLGGNIVALSGETDLISGPRVTCEIDLGDPLMGQVTAMGCALGAVIAAFIAVSVEETDGTDAARALLASLTAAALSVTPCLEGAGAAPAAC